MKKLFLTSLLLMSLISCTNNGETSSSNQMISSDNTSSEFVSFESSSEDVLSEISSENEVISIESSIESSELESTTSNKYNVQSEDIVDISFGETIIH